MRSQTSDTSVTSETRPTRKVVFARRLGMVVLGLALPLALVACYSGQYAPTHCGACRGEDSCCPTPPEEYPKEAKPGESWCKILIPGETKRVWEDVCVECPGCREEWVPPKTLTKVHEVCVKPASCREIKVPAVWQDLEECVEVCPGQFEKRCRRVCVQCESTTCVYEAAQYQTCVEECEICPGYWKSKPTPPIVDRRYHEVCVKPARWEWRRNPTCEAPKPCAPPPCAPPPCPPPPPPCPPPAVKPPGLTALPVGTSDEKSTAAESATIAIGIELPREVESTTLRGVPTIPIAAR